MNAPVVRLRVGVDLVRVSRIAESLERFGTRFLRRIFTADEIAYAMAAPALAPERLAARFAAKEAALKALDLVEHPRDWRDIEVCRRTSGACELALHGALREAATRAGADSFALSLSHEGDFATAVVITSVHETRS